MLIKPKENLSDERIVEMLDQFLIDSDTARSWYTETDRQFIKDYMVLPEMDNYHEHRRQGKSVIKSPEVHQAVETMLARMMIQLFGPRGFISVQPQGLEDAGFAKNAALLLEKSFQVPGNYRAQYEAFKTSLIHGAAVIAPRWKYNENVIPRRKSITHPMTGEQLDFVVAEPVITRDDIYTDNIDLENFFPDPKGCPIDRMDMCAERGLISASEALKMVDMGRWKREPVERAIKSISSDGSGVTTDGKSLDDTEYRLGLDRPTDTRPITSYGYMVYYEFHSQDLPFTPPDGQKRRRMTTLNGELVENRPHPSPISRGIPLFEFCPNPIANRFRGIGLPALTQFTGSLLDASLMMFADTALKKADQPVIYDRNQQVDVSALRQGKGPIGANSTEAVKTIDYNPPTNDLLQLTGILTQGIREGTGSVGALQGANQPGRQSATESRLTFDAAAGRPGMNAALYENEYLPAQGKAHLEMYQFFIKDQEDLMNRIGISNFNTNPMPMSDFRVEADVKFVGSSNMETKSMEIEALERIMAVVGANPAIASEVDWSLYLKEMFTALNKPELALSVGEEIRRDEFIQRSQRTQGGGLGNGNREQPSSGPAGALPAQVSGRALG